MTNLLDVFSRPRSSEETREGDGGGGDWRVDVKVKGHGDLGDSALRVTVRGAFTSGLALVGHQHDTTILAKLYVPGHGSNCNTSVCRFYSKKVK